jgi:choline dehydrogenase-like flavoprotein
VLQLSGIGSSDLLQKYNVPVVVDLPGVGANFHDHPMVFVFGTYENDLNPSPSNTTNTTWMAEQKELYDTKREGKLGMIVLEMVGSRLISFKGIYTTSRGNAVAYLPLNETTSNTSTIVNALKKQDARNLYPKGTHPSIFAGWKAQRDILAKKITTSTIATSELAFGPSVFGGLALVKPFSRGSITINSTDPFDFPVLDFATLRNPLDLDMFVAIIRTWRKITKTSALAPLQPARSFPDDSIDSTADLEEFVRSNILPTWAHPAGTAAMLKKELGGVVGTDLLVYGTQRLSVVDASIIPVCPSTHTTTTVYAIAEKVRYLFSLLLL